MEWNSIMKVNSSMWVDHVNLMLMGGEGIEKKYDSIYIKIRSTMLNDA